MKLLLGPLEFVCGKKKKTKTILFPCPMFFISNLIIYQRFVSLSHFILDNIQRIVYWWRDSLSPHSSYYDGNDNSNKTYKEQKVIIPENISVFTYTWRTEELFFVIVISFLFSTSCKITTKSTNIFKLFRDLTNFHWPNIQKWINK